MSDKISGIQWQLLEKVRLTRYNAGDIVNTTEGVVWIRSQEHRSKES